MVSSKCHAKINLYLKVLGRREDGFHALDTLFQEIDLYDELHWDPGEDPLSLTVVGADKRILEGFERNLVIQAADAFTEHTGQRVGGQIRLVKRIPAGGGLGGGSSDAAAMLRLLNDHYHARLSTRELAKLALCCGSDVPFFLLGGSQRGRGRGEQLTPTALPDCPQGGHLILPAIHIATADVFRNFAKTGKPAPVRLVQQPTIGENDLLPSALTVAPKLASLWRDLNGVSNGSTLFMTGSGSTLVWLDGQRPLPLAVQAVLTAHEATWIPFRFHASQRNL